MQEVLEVFQLSEGPPVDSCDSSVQPDQPEQFFLMLSCAAVSSAFAPHTMCLFGSIQGHPLRILVASGSSHTFISSDITIQLSSAHALVPPLQVRVANGQMLSCTTFFPRAVWQMQGYEFIADLKVLPLPCYDMTLGLDWLSSHSPMEVHWQQQWMSIPYQGSSILLYGHLSAVPTGTLMEVSAVSPSQELSVPVEVHHLLEEFRGLFAVPSELPPSRPCDHAIPLLNGASPVQVRPYRFTPAVKDEIERQVHDMLSSGLIQKSSSPFSLLVLLVRKQDNTWRFCVDTVN